jgi:acetyl-CoA decarbonylase/synthase complex subunit gamma
MATPIGNVPCVSADIAMRDRWGAVMARWGISRMQYTVDPGLYALGNPDQSSPVLVTANYKMSFDKLREALLGRHAWILVLDTKGINVWCAAGKGTFGTEELVHRIEVCCLKQLVDHRDLILPQLAAPGVAAHDVTRQSGFKVNYGPIRAADLPDYLDGGMVATPGMRRKTFTFRERSVLIPIELVGALKPGGLVLLIFFLLSGLGGPMGYWARVWQDGPWIVSALLAAIFAGAVFSPAFLPYLPGRAFSFKGFAVGLITAVALILLRDPNLMSWAGRLESLAWLLLVTSAASYLAMNFTGASTFSSLSGVLQEMRVALPLQIIGFAAGALVFLAGRFVS